MGVPDCGPQSGRRGPGRPGRQRPYSPHIRPDPEIARLVRAARDATRRCEQIDAKAEDARKARDSAILALVEATSMRRAAAELGITFGRVQQIVRRARS